MASARLRALKKEVASLGDPARAAGVARFFKTGKGEYGEGDKFLGIYVPELRRLARKERELPVSEALEMLRSSWHEQRLLALMILVDRHKRAAPGEKDRIHRAYLANTRYINNWDLVDISAGEIVGYHVSKEGTRRIERLAKSKLLWERRIAMIATSYTTAEHNFAPALLVAERLLGDDHDLMHKAVGWMLREVGKRDVEVLRAFLTTHAASMPRTALRYAIERFPEPERKRWLMARSAKTSTPRSRRPSASLR